MQRRNIYLKIFLSIFVVILLFGCSKKDDKKSNRNDDIRKVSYNQSVSKEAKKKILAMEEITDVYAVNTDKDLYLAAKPQHHERLQLAQLEKKMKLNLEKQFPNYKIHVSLDKKILKLLSDLEGNIKKGNVNQKQVDKKLEFVKSEMKSDI
ncbi:YhcN/YlaJ family sporulation lipoprotein [Bacillus sp. RG28]|uniref:YhcN/YlaJ family sporulation lipoprotein n=1 Tax=Gottfriedia endophytica TaxID=2820819 RepID=A0A940NTP8_9BACI|nr:YhcN/YlaJ family sporulation lipoprotein [Gottfriedia endophytica]MBP0726596.1 YhcN/YlaJ family sporulation lipoprotein [Gottfriedia endophytica]